MTAPPRTGERSAPIIDKAKRGSYLSREPCSSARKWASLAFFALFIVGVIVRGAFGRWTEKSAAISRGTGSERSKMLSSALKFDSVMKRVFGSSNDRRLKGYRPKVAAINALEPEFEALSNEQLLAKTAELRAELAAGKKLDDLIAPAFAAVREAAKRTLKQRHFDVQLIGGLVLHEGAIAEMRTGEGKTLVATTAVYLNALAGEGVHVVTVNDYLARRDAEWMGADLQVSRHDSRRHRPWA